MLLPDFNKIAAQSPFHLELNVSLKKLNSWRMGANAWAVAQPRKKEDLEKLLNWISIHKIPFAIIGWGSNLLCPDEDFEGLVIRLKFFEDKIIADDGGTVYCGAGVGAAILIREAVKNGWGGVDRLVGIPGSVGGMIVMNAGTHLGTIQDLVLSVDILRRGENGQWSQIRTTPTAADWDYRAGLFIQPGDIVVGATFRFPAADAQELEKQITKLYERRKETQPVDLPSCGSVFKNPKEHGLQAWQVIEKLGLRGYRLGDAQFSEKHANFIVNLGDAKAADVDNLIQLAIRRAKDELGIVLHPEVRYLR